MKTVMELLSHVESKLKNAYVWGAKGEKCTMSMLELFRLRYYTSTSSYCPWNDGNNGYTYKERCYIWLRPVGEELESFDCGGLFDNLFGIDRSAAGYYLESLVKGSIGTIPAGKKGLQVFKTSTTGGIVHVGCYMGDGTVIEAKNTASGVVRTTFAGAGWDLWAECYLIDYTGDDIVILQKGTKGQEVYNYQMIVKRLGNNIGTFSDMVLKDAAGLPLRTGCDGSFGSTMVTITNALCVKYGLPTMDTGIVTDALMGKINEALIALKVGATKVEYDALALNLKTTEINLTNANKTIVTLETQLKEANARIYSSTLETAVANEKVIYLNKQVTISYDEIKVLNDQIKILNDQISFLSDQIDILEDSNGKLEASIDLLGLEVSRLTAQSNDLIKKINDLEIIIDDLNEKITDLTHERDFARENAKTYSTDLIMLSTIINKYIPV